MTTVYAILLISGLFVIAFMFIGYLVWEVLMQVRKVKHQTPWQIRNIRKK